MKALSSALPLLLLLYGCGGERPPAPTAEESRRLDEADAMLNELDRDVPRNKAR